MEPKEIKSFWCEQNGEKVERQSYKTFVIFLPAK